MHNLLLKMESKRIRNTYRICTRGGMCEPTIARILRFSLQMINGWLTLALFDVLRSLFAHDDGG